MKGIVFDFDDVLCDTRYAHKSSLKGALKEFNYFWNDNIENEYRKVYRHSTRARLQGLVEKGLVRKEDVDPIDVSKRAIMSDMMADAQFPERYFKRLSWLKHQHDLTFAIASDTDRAIVIAFLKWTRLNEIIDFVTTPADIGSADMSPALFVASAEKMKLPLDQVVAFQRCQPNVIAARTAPVRFVFEASFSHLENYLNGFERELKRS